MKVDLRITGGTVIDPERRINAPGEVLVLGNTIVEARARGDGRSRNDDRCPRLPRSSRA